ncbi:hypothetical protein DB32_005782 [Sandaracinus amylolyticus]|uniref:Uncharacterized protein n=1 Tax=Sandaracinus amylolyticus TaxID=927083 RepID=A0A0F6W6N8_9BACT|nr:hypothetical protein DB32_005782 [Sandaracinus amylolyticus]
MVRTASSLTRMITIVNVAPSSESRGFGCSRWFGSVGFVVPSSRSPSRPRSPDAESHPRRRP